MPRKPSSNACPLSLPSIANASVRDTGASPTALSFINSTKMPPSPTTISGPNSGSTRAPTMISTPWGTIARRVKADASGQKFVLRFRATRLPGEVAGPDRTRYLEFLEGARETFQALLPLESGKSP